MFGHPPPGAASAVGMPRGLSPAAGGASPARDAGSATGAAHSPPELTAGHPSKGPVPDVRPRLPTGVVQSAAPPPPRSRPFRQLLPTTHRVCIDSSSPTGEQACPATAARRPPPAAHPPARPALAPATLTAAGGGALLLRLLPAGCGRGQAAGAGGRLHHAGAVLGVEEQGGPGLLQEGLRDAGQERAAPHHRLHARHRTGHWPQSAGNGDRRHGTGTGDTERLPSTRRRRRRLYSPGGQGAGALRRRTAQAPAGAERAAGGSCSAGRGRRSPGGFPGRREVRKGAGRLPVRCEEAEGAESRRCVRGRGAQPVPGAVWSARVEEAGGCPGAALPAAPGCSSQKSCFPGGPLAPSRAGLGATGGPVPRSERETALPRPVSCVPFRNAHLWLRAEPLPGGWESSGWSHGGRRGPEPLSVCLRSV